MIHHCATITYDAADFPPRARKRATFPPPPFVDGQCVTLVYSPHPAAQYPIPEAVRRAPGSDPAGDPTLPAAAGEAGSPAAGAE
jgi:hypothetical protein